MDSLRSNGFPEMLLLTSQQAGGANSTSSLTLVEASPKSYRLLALTLSSSDSEHIQQGWPDSSLVPISPVREQIG